MFLRMICAMPSPRSRVSKVLPVTFSSIGESARRHRDSDQIGAAEFGGAHDVLGHRQGRHEVAGVDVVFGQGDHRNELGRHPTGFVAVGALGHPLHRAVGDRGALKTGDLGGGDAEVVAVGRRDRRLRSPRSSRNCSTSFSASSIMSPNPFSSRTRLRVSSRRRSADGVADRLRRLRDAS